MPTNIKRPCAFAQARPVDYCSYYSTCEACIRDRKEQMDAFYARTHTQPHY